MFIERVIVINSFLREYKVARSNLNTPAKI